MLKNHNNKRSPNQTRQRSPGICTHMIFLNKLQTTGCLLVEGKYIHIFNPHWVISCSVGPCWCSCGHQSNVKIRRVLARALNIPRATTNVQFTALLDPRTCSSRRRRARCEKTMCPAQDCSQPKRSGSAMQQTDTWCEELHWIHGAVVWLMVTDLAEGLNDACRAVFDE